MSRRAVVAGVWRHPVKSMQGEALDAAVLERDGIAGDRAWGVVDRSSGLVLNAKREGRLLLASARAAASDPAQPPVVSVPGRGEVQAGGRIVLSILGKDAWKPMVLFVFGLDTASGRPNQIVTLVSLPVWGPRWMSKDMSEGDASVDLQVTPG